MMLMRTRTSPTGPIPPMEAERGFDVRELIGFVWRQWMVILSIVVTTLIIAAVHSWTATPRYTAGALILLEPQREKNPGIDANIPDGNLDLAMMESQLAIIKSSVFLQRVVERLNLVTDPEFGTGSPRVSSTQGGVPTDAPLNAKAEAASPLSENGVSSDIVSSAERLKGAVSVGRAGQGYVLSVSVTSVDPTRAARLANAAADAYVVEKLDARFEAAKRASTWLNDRLVDLKKQLRDSEEAVAKFRNENGFLQSNANVTLNQQQLSELNAQLLAARAETADKKARLEILRNIEEKGGNVQALPDVANSPSFAALRQQEAAISQKEADLTARYNGQHPLVVNVRAERNDIKRAIAAEIKRSANNVNNEYELAKAREATLDRALREVTGQTGIDDRTAITLRELERTAAVNKSLFEDFLQKAKTSQQQSTFEARDARVITPALPPGAPSYPRTLQTMEIALFIGLLLGIGGAVAKDKLNGGFTTPRQIEDMLGVPLLTSLNSMHQKDLTVEGKVLKVPEYVAAMPLSGFSEAVRTLRSGVKMTDVDDPPKVILVTSTSSDEGKTTVALSLAVSAAASGQRVLLVDADLRHAASSRFLGMETSPGLVDLLLSKVNTQDIITYDENAKLWMLAAGSKTRAPADLIGSDRMKSFMTASKKSFDFVVIDAPPIGPVIDSLILSELVDKIVYVVRWASTARELVHQSIQRLPRDKLAGVAFNRVNENLAQRYGRHAYQYYYGARDYKKYYKG